MKKFSPYISFNGDCKKALEFYKEVFGGQILNLALFSDSPVEVDEEDKDRVMHAVFESDAVFFMAADTMPGSCVFVGDNISFSLEFEHLDVQKRIFEQMAEDGTIVMPLQDTFWGTTFGMLVDQFGMSWMFNCESPVVETNE